MSYLFEEKAPSFTVIAFLFAGYAVWLCSSDNVLKAGPFKLFLIALAMAAATGLLFRRNWGRVCGLAVLWMVIGNVSLGFLLLVPYMIKWGVPPSAFACWILVSTPAVFLFRFLSHPSTRRQLR